MVHGYAGSILKVDLTRGAIEVEKPPESFYRKYVGGSAMGACYLLRDCPAGTDALAPDNVLTLAAGPVAGAALAGASRLSATAKSPLTGLAGDSQVGGYVAAELKFAGFDAVVIKGKALRPVYLLIRDGQAELRDARGLWGKGTAETEDAIRAELRDDRVEVLEIGPAGEKLSRMAAIMHRASRAAGRNGLGAVMGSKNLKAVAVRGTGRPDFADSGAMKGLARYAAEQMKSNAAMQDLQENGSNSSLASINASGGLPTRNYREGSFEGADELAASVTTVKFLKDRETCYGCPVRCKRVVEIKEGPFPVDPRYGGAEYESMAALGSYCGVRDQAAVQLANQLCNFYGLDTISVGATIAFAMECFEAGLLPAAKTGGLELKFGNPAALVEMVHRIGMRDGLGDLLAEGSERAARTLGPRAKAFLTTSKSQELPAHMPNLKKSLALIYAVNPFGADHESTEHDPCYEEGTGSRFLDRVGQLGLHDPPARGSFGQEKVRFVVYTQRYFSVLDTVPLCHFCYAIWSMFDPNHVSDAVRAATGWDTNLLELMMVGERRINLLRAFNAREGAGKKDDTLPSRCFEPLRGMGGLVGTAVEREAFTQALDLYYRMSGWNPATGNPTAAKYQELGLGWVVEALGLKDD